MFNRLRFDQKKKMFLLFIALVKKYSLFVEIAFTKISLLKIYRPNFYPILLSFLRLVNYPRRIVEYGEDKHHPSITHHLIERLHFLLWKYPMDR